MGDDMLSDNYFRWHWKSISEDIEDKYTRRTEVLGHLSHNKYEESEKTFWTKKLTKHLKDNPWINTSVLYKTLQYSVGSPGTWSEPIVQQRDLFSVGDFLKNDIRTLPACGPHNKSGEMAKRACRAFNIYRVQRGWAGCFAGCTYKPLTEQDLECLTHLKKSQKFYWGFKYPSLAEPKPTTKYKKKVKNPGSCTECKEYKKCEERNSKRLSIHEYDKRNRTHKLCKKVKDYVDQDWIEGWEKTNYEPSEKDLDRYGVADFADEADDNAEGEINTRLEMVALYATGRTQWDRVKRWADDRFYRDDFGKIVFPLPPPQAFKSWEDPKIYKREVVSECVKGIEGFFYYDPFDTKKKINYFGSEKPYYKSAPKERTEFAPNIWDYFPTDNDLKRIIIEMYFRARNKPVVIAEYLNVSKAFVSKVLKQARDDYRSIIEQRIENMDENDKDKLTKKIGYELIFQRYLNNIKQSDIAKKKGLSKGYISQLFSMIWEKPRNRKNEVNLLKLNKKDVY